MTRSQLKLRFIFSALRDRGRWMSEFREVLMVSSTHVLEEGSVPTASSKNKTELWT